MGCWGGDQRDGDTGVRLVDPPKGTHRVPCAAVPRISLGPPRGGTGLGWRGESLCVSPPPHSPPGSPLWLGPPWEFKNKELSLCTGAGAGQSKAEPKEQHPPPATATRHEHSREGAGTPLPPPAETGRGRGLSPPAPSPVAERLGWVWGCGWVWDWGGFSPFFFFFSFFLLSSSFWLFFLSFCFLQTQALEGGSRGQGRGDRHADACFGGPQLRLPPRLPSPSPSGWNQDSHRKLFTAAGRRGPPSRGSGRSATCRRGGARRGSPRTGWCGAGPARRCTG